jgi:hypothetical protein
MLTEDQGIQAIIALQKMNGITETAEKARRNWNNFADWEKKSTEEAYVTFFGRSDKGGRDARN